MTEEFREKMAALQYQVGETREFEYSDGTKVAGAISRVLTKEGGVKIAFLRDAVVLNGDGEQIYRTYEMPIILDRLADVG